MISRASVVLLYGLELLLAVRLSAIQAKNATQARSFESHWFNFNRDARLLSKLGIKVSHAHAIFIPS